ncbi:unnamed protein product [Amoebophrya sp. A25]|nr:unnamed protein product [Amoebophrya sp. A25]|eukprot:GSA25T00027225001.1
MLAASQKKSPAVSSARPPAAEPMSAYAALAPGSMMAAKVEHGLQTGAIYWETNMNPFNGVFGQGTYGQKWSWQMWDDTVRSSMGLDEDTRNTPLIFHNDGAFDRAWVRDYKGDRNIYDIKPAKKKWNFSFFPTGTKDPLETKAEGEMTRGDVFAGVLASCLKVDLAHALEQATD